MVVIAVSGCVHGELDQLYSNLDRLEKKIHKKADILLCTGDFQAIRNEYDLQTLSCPPRYRKLGDFQKYYRKQARAPILTVFIGGNHEAVVHMHSAQQGGWVAPDIYYMGRSGVINYGSLTIAGISGIYNPKCFDRPLPEFPRSEKDYKTLFRVRRSDIDRIRHISSPDILMTHDWPQGIYHYGDTARLLSIKPFLTEQVRDSSLGNPYYTELLEQIKPKYWFSSHMHVKFPAVYKQTRFLALDKAIRPKDFIQILDFPGEPAFLEPNPEWLALNSISPQTQFTQLYPD